MADKQINLKFVADGEFSDIETLEQKIAKLKNEKLNFRIDADSSKIVSIDEEIAKTKSQIKELSATEIDVRTNMNEINNLVAKIDSLEAEKVDLQIDIETAELEKVKGSIQELENEEVEIQLRNQSAMEAIGQISDGFSRLRQGASEIKGKIDEVQKAGMQSEQNKAFLEMNLGADKAKQTYQDISDIVASMPGDDNTMRAVLSTAQALGNNLKPDEMKDAAGTMADYMSASATMGKMATESQQDIMKYLLDGNTAELERGSIVSTQVDKLKEAKTFQERQVAMQQVLNDLGYGGIAQQDTMLNKQAEWEGMIYNSQDALSSMWLGAEKGAMDFILKLNESTNGIVGMGIAMTSFASPVAEALMGLGQIATGISSIQSLGFISWLKNLEIASKLSAAATWLQNTALWGMIAPILANPITWLVIALIALAAAFIWAYQNVDWFREGVNDAWASLVQLGQQIYGVVIGAVQWLSNLFNQFTSQLGLNTNNWIQSILGFILFIPQLPLQVGIALINTIAKVLGFGPNFVQGLVSSAANAVNGFINYIRQLPSMIQAEFARIESLVSNFITSLPQRVWDLGANIVDALMGALGIGSPGYMFYMVEGEFNRIDSLTKKTNFDTGSIGQDMVNNFNPNFETANASVSGAYGSNITINIESVDSQERINQIVEAVENALKFDNLKAGRTV